MTTTIGQVAVYMTARIIGTEGMVEHQSEMLEMVTETNIIIEERIGLTDRAHETGNDAESGAGRERKMETDGKMDIERGAAKGAEMVGVSRMMADAMTEIDATASGLEAEKSIAHAEMIRRIDAWSALEAAHGRRTGTATPHNPNPKPAPPAGPRSQKGIPPPTKPSKAPSDQNGTAQPTAGPSVPPSKAPGGKPLTANPVAEKMEVDEDPEVALLRQTMGFVGFRSTKQTKVPGNNIYGVRKEKKMEYRQYMNRVGGFNRPLSPSR
ncbi:MAG: hypothetical protein Q9191_001838 [Dirinaria sp. TL-2023a]